MRILHWHKLTEKATDGVVSHLLCSMDIWHLSICGPTEPALKALKRMQREKAHLPFSPDLGRNSNRAMLDGSSSSLQEQSTLLALERGNNKSSRDSTRTTSVFCRKAKTARTHPEEVRSPSTHLKSLIEPRVLIRKKYGDATIPASRAAFLLANYDNESVRAIRNNDIDCLRKLLVAGKSFDACNLAGETLLHLACRRGKVETVTFLLHEACVDVNVHDELGRTVLHDICWRPTPHVQLMEMLADAAAVDLLLVEDARGHCCFDYCRKEHWLEWNGFLEGYARSLRTRLSMVTAPING